MEGTNIIENMMGPKFNEKSKQYYIERANNDVGLFHPRDDSSLFYDGR